MLCNDEKERNSYMALKQEFSINAVSLLDQS